MNNKQQQVQENEKEVAGILLRGTQGLDCDEHESAELKYFVREHYGKNTADGTLQDIWRLFPCEYSEAMEDIENNVTND